MKKKKLYLILENYILNNINNINIINIIIIKYLLIISNNINYIANDIIDILTVNIQGKKNNEETWKEDGVSFVLNPSNIIQDTIPEGCSLWYDGCNLCQINNGILGRCTRNMCITDDEPECRVFNSGH